MPSLSFGVSSQIHLAQAHSSHSSSFQPSLVSCCARPSSSPLSQHKRRVYGSEVHVWVTNLCVIYFLSSHSAFCGGFMIMIIFIWHMAEASRASHSKKNRMTTLNIESLKVRHGWRCEQKWESRSGKIVSLTFFFHSLALFTRAPCCVLVVPFGPAAIRISHRLRVG